MVRTGSSWKIPNLTVGKKVTFTLMPRVVGQFESLDRGEGNTLHLITVYNWALSCKEDQRLV